MKKLGLLIGLCCSFGLVNGQTTTSYGTGAGTGGANNSFFGYYSGNNILNGFDNTGVGKFSLLSNDTGFENTAIGSNALKSNIDGINNTAIGSQALSDNLVGSANVAVGRGALTSNLGDANVAVGTNAMANNTTGHSNIGIGIDALLSNTTGNQNVAIGSSALYLNTTGQDNTAVGEQALSNNTTGNYNTATGYFSMLNNTTGNYNTATGYFSMQSSTTGIYNTSIGYESMKLNTTGRYNTSNGALSLLNNTTGDKNTAMGNNAATANTTGKNLTAIGYDALRYNTTGTGNTAIGYKAGPGSAGSTYLYSSGLGAYAVPTASYQVRVGHFGITSIGGAQNWTNLSDGRFKKEVEENVIGLDFIKALRPVSYYVDNAAVNKFLGVELEDEAINNKKQYQTGFIAQEVEATAKELGFEHFGGVDAPANDNSHYGLRYAEFVVPLVKSVQELSAQNERQTTTIEDLKALIAAQQTQINDLLEAKNTNLNTATISSQSKAVLYQNAPNPFTHETQIKLFVPEDVEQAFIQVCTIDGKQLFVKEVAGRSETSVMLEAGNLSAGIYMYTLVVDHEIVASKRMMLTK